MLTCKSHEGKLSREECPVSIAFCCSSDGTPLVMPEINASNPSQGLVLDLLNEEKESLSNYDGNAGEHKEYNREGV